nr:immunoglobulin heavy chain junction region [Macaca mulatta]
CATSPSDSWLFWYFDFW